MPANVDVGPALDEIEEALRSDAELTRRVRAVTILKRWQHDRDLDERSRSRAGDLLRKFGDPLTLRS